DEGTSHARRGRENQIVNTRKMPDTYPISTVDQGRATLSRHPHRAFWVLFVCSQFLNHPILPLEDSRIGAHTATPHISAGDLTEETAPMSDHALFDPERAVRFTFRVSGANIELLEQRHLAMAVLPSHPLDLGTVQSGFWFELQDSERRAVYRRTMSNP